MSRVMVNIRSPDGAPTLKVVKERYGLRDDEIDDQFGVIEIDPEDNIYSVLVDQAAAPKLGSTADWSVDGPYSNPRIATFE